MNYNLRENMDLKKAIKNRHSIRSFSDKKIPDNIIEEIIEYANLAPSAGNAQARDFVIVNDKDIKKKITKAALNQKFISEAPVAIVVCANQERNFSYGPRGRNLYCIQDATAAIEHILLLAVDYGLDTCWVGAFDEDKVSNILNLPDHIRPVAIIPIGYSNEQKTATSRLELKKLIHYNSW
jgi:nitroreductase